MSKRRGMNVLVACEFSGRVRDAFIARGHNAVSCDLLPSESSGPHIQGDAIEVACHGVWDLMIAHPPCTYLCNSGVCWLHRQPGRWDKMRHGADFFKSLLELDIPKIAIENPIMHKYAVAIIGRRQDQVIQPWQFGHGEQKATCLWLKGLEKLRPTKVVDGREQKLHRLPPSKDRWKLRATTYQGIADAMADQWGGEE